MLAWEAAARLETRAGAWYQRVAGLRVLRPPRTIDERRLAEDTARLEAFFRARGWVEARVSVERRASRHRVRQDVVFLVELGERTSSPPPPPDPAPSGWTLTPIASALGRGATMSVYGGLAATWREAAERPDVVELHGEVGIRAFPDPEDRPFGGNVGTFSDTHANWYRPVVGRASTVLGVRSGTDLWPAYNEIAPAVFGGLRWGEADPLELTAVVGVSAWGSWAWPDQRDAYRPWFEPGTPIPGQPLFLRSYTAARLDLAAAWDTTDRPVLPRSGVRARLAGTPLGFAAGAPLFRVEADGRVFVPLVGRWVIGALRARAGALDWQDPSGRSLLGERFFIEASDMRGWGTRRIVPPGYAGGTFDLRPGGDLVLFGNAELRWDVHRDLALAAFVDAGRVYEDPTRVSLDDLVMDAGVAGASPSPLGVVRLDVAFRLIEQASLEEPGVLALQLWLDQEW